MSTTITIEPEKSPLRNPQNPTNDEDDAHSGQRQPPPTPLNPSANTRSRIRVE